MHAQIRAGPRADPLFHPRCPLPMKGLSSPLQAARQSLIRQPRATLLSLQRRCQQMDSSASKKRKSKVQNTQTPHQHTPPTTSIGHGCSLRLHCSLFSSVVMYNCTGT